MPFLHTPTLWLHRLRPVGCPFATIYKGRFLCIYIFSILQTTDLWLKDGKKGDWKEKKSASFQSRIRSFHLWSLSRDWYKQQWGQDLPRQNLQTSYKIFAIKLPLFFICGDGDRIWLVILFYKDSWISIINFFHLLSPADRQKAKLTISYFPSLLCYCETFIKNRTLLVYSYNALKVFFIVSICCLQSE